MICTQSRVLTRAHREGSRTDKSWEGPPTHFAAPWSPGQTDETTNEQHSCSDEHTSTIAERYVVTPVSITLLNKRLCSNVWPPVAASARGTVKPYLPCTCSCSHNTFRLAFIQNYRTIKSIVDQETSSRVAKAKIPTNSDVCCLRLKGTGHLLLCNHP